MANLFDPQPQNPPTPAAQAKSALRSELRARRNALSVTQQAHASQGVLRHLMQLPQFMRARYLALYIANDGELDPAPVAEQLWKMGKQCYLPVLRPDQDKTLWFVEYTPDALLAKNRFGIPEPDFRHHHKLPAQRLDVVLMPLVGFDRSGARLGMGGGFYDTTFAFKQQNTVGKPCLIGLAHSCQQVDSLTTETWDIPLFAIATEQEILLTSN